MVVPTSDGHAEAAVMVAYSTLGIPPAQQLVTRLTLLDDDDGELLGLDEGEELLLGLLDDEGELLELEELDELLLLELLDRLEELDELLELLQRQSQDPRRAMASPSLRLGCS